MAQVLYVCKNKEEIISIHPSPIDAYDSLCERLLEEWAAKVGCAGALFEMKDIYNEFSNYVEQLDSSYENFYNNISACFGYKTYRVTKYKEEKQ